MARLLTFALLLSTAVSVIFGSVLLDVYQRQEALITNHSPSSSLIGSLLRSIRSAAAAMDPNSIEALEAELKANTIDPNTFARPDQAKVSHLHLALGVNFEKHIFAGSVLLTVDRVAPNATQLLLDTVDLTVDNVELVSLDGQSKSKLKWTLHKAVPEFGAKLEIDISPATGTSFKVQVDYQTSATARALQWLTPEQTEGGVYPYMFSQNEAINARSMVPCQDTPAVKATYTAEVCVSLVAHL